MFSLSATSQEDSVPVGKQIWEAAGLCEGRASMRQCDRAVNFELVEKGEEEGEEKEN